MTPAQRLRLHRWREARGVIVLQVEVEENALAGALLDAGRIGEAAATDRKALGAALSAFLAEILETRFSPAPGVIPDTAPNDTKEPAQ